MAKPVNLRHLSVAILVGLSTAGAAANATAGITTRSGPLVLNSQTSAVSAAAQAAAYLGAGLLSERLKALDALAACDAAMSPICRVDMGLAYGRLAQDAEVDALTRVSYADQARVRLRQAAALGNVQARRMLDSIDQLDEAAAHASIGAPSASAANASNPDAALAPVPTRRAAILDATSEELQSLRSQLEEANRTITLLQAQLATQLHSAFDAAATNRQALAAALDGNYETAIPLFRKAAEAGNPSAINNLAMMFVNSTGVPRDMQQALALFERAAAMGNVESAENAARIYKYGIGRPKDPSRARAWYSRAVQLGSVSAADELAAMEQAIQAGRNL
ncbi:tetratricopeptide repeat protein (plasmid) [Xanthomonas sontii]|uniref:tetratricopeptide repeat protein n=1 Tax=Xanthomonas sontii TaxID=2650745 RepID=UPI003F871316